jgi:polar amino acid transport system substrate-binding protein
MKALLVAASLLLGLPLAGQAAGGEPLRVALAGAYHPLLASERPATEEGFERALAQKLADALGRPLQLDGNAELVLGTSGASVPYYQSDIAALTANEGGAEHWSQLRGQTVCVAAGSPYAALLLQRFGAVAKSYPSAAHAVIGLKLGECRAVAGEALLLDALVPLPEWRRYNHELPRIAGYRLVLGVKAGNAQLQEQVDALLRKWSQNDELDALVKHWVDEVAFQAYVLSDTLDCH